MVDKKLSWIFSADGPEGIPYLECPYCGRKVGGSALLFGSMSFDICPDCKKSLTLENMKEEDYLLIREYYDREV